ncbi:NADH-quinone oxidoreductase subunit NuoE family protein [Kangiella sediminilitoris]|uniref:NADH-quinone oxidoreductase subunit E n=1 Tax=Kangiella sediminilitoris TaxID=1144748 RepID=A0A1B3BDC1_9GAMM|nr:NAD(P)H-dependent oxidoreductase subunit E [Kangiella sediminilitoris]AOE50816.1 NADH-quinone oxidoreductase, E subunit [Kangiella sediminilitoris]
MSQTETKTLEDLLSSKGLEQAADWVKKYPEERKRAAIIPIMSIVQEELGYLTQESMDAVADYLVCPKIAAYEVATFYSMFRLKAAGKYVISLCTNVSCMLAGSEDIKKWFKDELGIEPGETSADGKFTLKEVECMAACGGAPMLEVDKQYHENLTVDKVAHLIRELK